MTKNKQTSYFRSHGYTLDETITADTGESCKLSNLEPFLRTLLVMDGTVTKALEAWFWEPVKVIPLKNQLETKADTNGQIIDADVNPHDKILQREVVLQGQNSKKTFACARSSVFLKSLPADIASALEAGKIGIGELFREKGLETYRDIIHINYHPKPHKNDPLLENITGELISRTYQIWVNGSPAVRVTEYFPLAF